jgi:hypothetical protein
MQIPDLIRDKAVTGLQRMRADPIHHYDWRTRREIYQLFASYPEHLALAARSRLAISAAERVLPIFVSHFPDRDLPRRLLQTAVGLADGELERDNPQVLQTEDEGYHATGGYIAYDDTTQKILFNASYAAFAAYKALVEIRHLQDPWHNADRFSKSGDIYSLGARSETRHSTSGSEFTDEDWASLAAAGDTAAAAAMATASSEFDPSPRPEALREFWIWWVEEALPSAWKAAGT